jgi:DNA-binding CsgD family transcriptional regulator
VPAKQVDQSVGDGGDRGDLKRTHHGAATLIEHEPEVPYLVWQAPEIIVHATIARDETAPSQIDLDVLLAAAESLRNQRASAVEYLGLARALLLEGDVRQAESIAHDALKALVDHGWRVEVIDALALLAEIAAFKGQHERATRLIASTEKERRCLGLVAVPAGDEVTGRVLARIASALDEEELAKALGDGARLSLEEAVAYARRGRGERLAGGRGWDSLSPAEQEVVGLASQGRSNPEIASELFMSRNTVKAHLSHAYIKLGVSNRTELARLAISQAQSASKSRSEYPPG